MTEPDTTTNPSRQLFDDAVRALTAAALLPGWTAGPTTPNSSRWPSRGPPRTSAA